MSVPGSRLSASHQRNHRIHHHHHPQYTAAMTNEAWYFGYGANMAAAVFIERRKIAPLRTEVAYIPTHALCFNVQGIPYADPGNGGLRPLSSYKTKGAPTNKDAVHGVAYLLTEEDLKKVVLSEGYV